MLFDPSIIPVDLRQDNIFDLYEQEIFYSN